MKKLGERRLQEAIDGFLSTVATVKRVDLKKAVADWNALRQPKTVAMAAGPTAWRRPLGRFERGRSVLFSAAVNKPEAEAQARQGGRAGFRNEGVLELETRYTTEYWQRWHNTAACRAIADSG